MPQSTTNPAATQTGPGVDSRGAPVPDPTANVLALVDAAERRLDDLRAAESLRVNEAMALRSDHARDLREAEAKRIDAIRAVDVMAVSVDRERSADAAKVLATQVATSAETLRALVASTAEAQASQTATHFQQVNDRIASLEKSQYQGAGKGVGQSSLMGWIFTGIATAVAVGSLIVLATR